MSAPASPAAATSPRKRNLPSDDEESNAKRQKTEIGLSATPAEDNESLLPHATKVIIPSLDYQAKSGLERSIGLALQHVGFDSATTEAMESYLVTVETCEKP